MDNDIPNFKPIERTLYPPIRDLLINLGFQVIQEIGISEEKKYIDILCEYEGKYYIFEIKIGNNYHELLKGLVQVWGYSQKMRVKELVVILFPEDVRNYAYSIEEIENRVKFMTCKSLFLTSSWWDLEDLTIDQSLNELKARIDKNLSASKKIEVVSTLLEDSIKTLSKLISKHYKNIKSLDETLNYLTKDQGLFLGLTKTKKTDKFSNKLQGEVINVLAYILVNQILFYFLYSKKTSKVPEIEPINNLYNLNQYFDKIKSINFRPIFDIDTISRIPPNNEILIEINTIIEALSALKVVEIKHDLYGRLIGKCMPEETRKTLASYYTKIPSSELLAQLTIDRWDEKVWDTACGSGTLLVSAYNKKLELYKINRREGLKSNEKNRIHKEFLEKQITGTDIMPFACHLTALNLSAQNLGVHPEFLRITNKNSLQFIDLSKKIEVREAYEDISNALEIIRDPQQYMEKYMPNQINKTKKVNHQEGKKFYLEKPDVVIINPPFTLLKHIPDNFKKAFQKRKIIDISGKEINLWGYFLAHSDIILKNGGKIGAIIPIGFLRGKRTQKIREYFLKNYSIDYIVKPSLNSSFSEDSNFNDLILVARKSPFEVNHEVKIVFLNRNIDKMSSEDIKPIINKIKTELSDKIDTEYYSLIKINQKDLFNMRNNLMPLFFSNKIHIIEHVNSLVDRIKSNKIMDKLDINLMEGGYELRNEEKPRDSVINRYFDKSRITKAKYYFRNGNDEYLTYYDKDNITHKIKISNLEKTFRTITGVNVYDISKKYDYYIKYKEKEKNNTFLMIPSRFSLISKNTYATALYIDNKITPIDYFIMYLCPTREESKCFCLYFQSVFFLIQVIKFCKKGMNKGGFANYFEIKQKDLAEINAPNFKIVSKQKIMNCIKFFDEIKDKNLHPIITQIRDKTEDRIKLDLFINELLELRFTRKEIEEMYELITNELTKNQ